MTQTGASGAAMAPVGVGAPVAVLGGALCLSLSAILVKVAEVDAATTAVLRCAIAVVVLVPMAVLEALRRGRLSRKGVGWAVAAGAALGIDYAAWTAAIYEVGAGVSAVLINVQVVVLPLLAYAVDRERISGRFLATLPLMLVAISLVGGVWDGPQPADGAMRGTGLGLIAGIGYGIYLFVTRRATKGGQGLSIQTLTWATASAALTALLVSPISGGVEFAGIDLRAWGLLALLAVLGQVVAWLLINRGSVRLPPTTTAALLLIQPVLALSLAAALLGERPSRLQLLGAVLVILAVAITNVVPGRRDGRGASRRVRGSR